MRWIGSASWKRNWKADNRRSQDRRKWGRKEKDGMTETLTTVGVWAVIGLLAVINVPQVGDALPAASMLEYGALGALVLVIGLWTWERRVERAAILEFQERVIGRNTAAMEQVAREMAVLGQRWREGSQ